MESVRLCTRLLLELCQSEHVAALTFRSHCRNWEGEPEPLEQQKLAWMRKDRLRDYPMPAADVPLIPILQVWLSKAAARYPCPPQMASHHERRRAALSDAAVEITGGRTISQNDSQFGHD